jgi:hypothetical protein
LTDLFAKEAFNRIHNAFASILGGISGVFDSILGAPHVLTSATFGFIANTSGSTSHLVDLALHLTNAFLGTAFELVGGARASFAVKLTLGPLLHNVTRFVAQSAGWGAKAKQQARTNDQSS